MVNDPSSINEKECRILRHELRNEITARLNTSDEKLDNIYKTLSDIKQNDVGQARDIAYLTIGMKGLVDSSKDIAENYVRKWVFNLIVVLFAAVIGSLFTLTISIKWEQAEIKTSLSTIVKTLDNYELENN